MPPNEQAASIYTPTIIARNQIKIHKGNSESKDEQPKGKQMTTTAKFGGEQQEDDSSQPIVDRRKRNSENKLLLKFQSGPTGSLF